MSESRKLASRRFYALRTWRGLPCSPGRYLGALAPALAGAAVGLFMGGVVAPLHAEGVTVVAPPAVYPATTWQGRGSAVLRIMRRLDSHVERVPLHVGEEVQYGTLSLRLERCLQKPVGLPAQSAALLHIEEKQDAGSPTFDGWMFTDDPALGAYAGALYDVQIITCEGEAVAPMAGPLPSPVMPHLPAIMAPHVEADGDRAVSPDGGQAPSVPGGGGPGGGQSDSGSGPLSLLPPAAPAPSQPVPPSQPGESGQH